MLGFGKKKKKDAQKEAVSTEDPPDKAKKSPGKDEPEAADPPKKKKKKKRFSLKLLVILFLVLAAIGVSGYVVYSLYFTPKDPLAPPRYKEMELIHVKLPEEMVRFTADHFPDLYVSMLHFNATIDLFDEEIARIDAILQKYPDQKKISEREKKTWEKAKAALEKSFAKVEKPVKETYVLFQVNKELGLTRIEALRSDLTELGKNAFLPSKELAQKLESKEKIPEGFVQGIIYKLKKIFL